MLRYQNGKITIYGRGLQDRPLGAGVEEQGDGYPSAKSVTIGALRNVAKVISPSRVVAGAQCRAGEMGGEPEREGAAQNSAGRAGAGVCCWT
jgi:hypothetical protein